MMGMFDDIKFETECPSCNNKIDGFQSKDGPCAMFNLDFWEVNNFYSSCDKCHTQIRYEIVSKPNREIKIEDYDKIITYPGKIHKKLYDDNDKRVQELFESSEREE